MDHRLASMDLAPALTVGAIVAGCLLVLSCCAPAPKKTTRANGDSLETWTRQLDSLIAVGRVVVPTADLDDCPESGVSQPMRNPKTLALFLLGDDTSARDRDELARKMDDRDFEKMCRTWLVTGMPPYTMSALAESSLAYGTICPTWDDYVTRAHYRRTAEAQASYELPYGGAAVEAVTVIGEDKTVTHPAHEKMRASRAAPASRSVELGIAIAAFPWLNEYFDQRIVYTLHFPGERIGSFPDTVNVERWSRVIIDREGTALTVTTERSLDSITIDALLRAGETDEAVRFRDDRRKWARDAPEGEATP